MVYLYLFSKDNGQRPLFGGLETHQRKRLTDLLTLLRILFRLQFLPRDVVLARVLAMALSVTLCLSQVGVLSKEMNRLIWFLEWGLLSTSTTQF